MLVTDPRPFYAGPASALSGQDRRLLLISYHFPPSNTAGALRWRKLAGPAAGRGWSLDVVTLDPSPGGHGSPDGLADLPPGTRVFGVAAPVLKRDRFVSSVMRTIRGIRGRTTVKSEPAGATKAQGATPARSPAPAGPAARPGALSRAYAALLDYAMHGRWSRDAAALANRLAEGTSYDAVISCGPPHMAHVAARDVAGRHGLPLVIDLRDPWRLVERLADVIDSPLWRWQAMARERRIIPHASLVVMNTEPARDAMRALYPAAAQRIIAVMNGFDDEPTPPPVRGRKFVVTYTGSIYLDRDPRPLFEAARRLVERRGLTPGDFAITFVGAVQEGKGGPTMAIARELGIEPYIELLPHRPRSELLGLLAGSAVLLSLPQDSHMAIPSKVFEYMQFDAWILALAEPHSAVARLLAGSPADVVAPGDIDRIADVLDRRLAQYRAGDYAVRLGVDRRFSRRGQAALLFDALERCTTKPLAAS